MKAITFNNVAHTEASLNEMSGPQLVKLFNQLAAELDQNLVKRFATKSAAVSRTWKLLMELPKPSGVDHGPANRRIAAAMAKDSSPKKERTRRGTNLSAPEGAPVACREGSKQALLLDMLSRKEGATMDELIGALSGGNKPWTEATVRSGFGWDMKQKGYGVRSEFSEDGQERFFIVLPEGFSIPPHRPLKGKPKADARQSNIKV